MKNLALVLEDTGVDVADILPDTEVEYLGSQARHQEDVYIAQVGEAGQESLGIVLTGHSGKHGVCHLTQRAVLMGSELEFGVVAHLELCEHLKRLLGCRKYCMVSLLVRHLCQVPRELIGLGQQVDAHV